MAKIHLSTQSDHPQLLNVESPEDGNAEDDNSEDDTPEEVMPQPWRGDLPDCQPKITTNIFYSAPVGDREILDDLREASENLSIHLQRTTLQSQVQELYKQVELYTNQQGVKDDWSFFFIYPTLRLALDISGLKDTVQIIPLQTTTVNPPSLLPQWKGTPVSRKVDFGLAVRFENDINHRITFLPDQENKEGGIGPASARKILQNHPLFCHIEAKKQHQVVDPIVQLGIWTSAVYTRWTQVKEVLQGSSSQDLPISFGWTVEGCYWRLHIIRCLPDGLRLTENSRVYDTRSPYDIYLIIATLHYLIKYGHEQFRKRFLDSVLDIRA